MEHLADDPPLWVDGTPAGLRFGTVEATAARFTFLVGDVAGLFRKLRFERDQFWKAHHAVPSDIDGIVYHCLNFIITAQSLYDWTKFELKARDGAKFDLESYDALIADRLPHHGLCREIANTLKHRGFRDGGWPGGRVKLDYIPGDGEGLKPGAELIFEQPDKLYMGALSLTAVIATEWQVFLVDLGLMAAPGAEAPPAPDDAPSASA